MSNNDLELRFGADASGIVAGGAEAKGAVEGILAAVKGLAGSLLGRTWRAAHDEV